jgi:hypothetical protein
MAVEAMARHGHAGDVGPWLDRYVMRLEEFPRATGTIGSEWRDALGDARRVADWTAFFRRQVAAEPWRQVLGTWWPRLLPGAIASATHGIIRTGHAVRALLVDGEDPVHVAELAHGLAYWAARWQPLTGAPAGGGGEPTGAGEPAGAGGGLAATVRRQEAGLTPAAALAAVPRIGDQSGGIRDRLPRLAGLAGWQAALAAPSGQDPEQARAWLAGLADAAVIGYPRYAHGNPVMLVHSATAPRAVLRVLPALSQDLWAPSAAAAWAAAAALTAIYAPPEPAPTEPAPAQSAVPADPGTDDEIFARAVAHGDEHAIKFADTAVEVHARTGDPAALSAALRAVELIPCPDK